MNKKKFLIFAVLTIFLVAISLSAVSASKTKSISFNIKKGKQVDHTLPNGDTISHIYEYRNNMGYPKGITIETFKKVKSGGLISPKHTKLIKVTVWFKKKNKIIKKSSSKVQYDFIRVNLVKGYRAYKLKVYYKNK